MAQEATAGSLGRDKGLACSGCWGWREDTHVTWGGMRGRKMQGRSGRGGPGPEPGDAEGLMSWRGSRADAGAAP